MANEVLVISVKLISLAFATGTLFVANLESLQLLILKARHMQTYPRNATIEPYVHPFASQLIASAENHLGGALQDHSSSNTNTSHIYQEGRSLCIYAKDVHQMGHRRYGKASIFIYLICRHKFFHTLLWPIVSWNCSTCIDPTSAKPNRQILFFLFDIFSSQLLSGGLFLQYAFLYKHSSDLCSTVSQKFYSTPA